MQRNLYATLWLCWPYPMQPKSDECRTPAMQPPVHPSARPKADNGVSTCCFGVHMEATTRDRHELETVSRTPLCCGHPSPAQSVFRQCPVTSSCKAHQHTAFWTQCTVDTRQLLLLSEGQRMQFARWHRGTWHGCREGQLLLHYVRVRQPPDPSLQPQQPAITLHEYESRVVGHVN